jgi:hypothetical protein
MSSDQESSFPAFLAGLEKFESATLYDELIQSGYAAGGGIAKIMQHTEKIDEARAAKLFLGWFIVSQDRQITHKSVSAIPAKLVAQLTDRNSECAAERARNVASNPVANLKGKWCIPPVAPQRLRPRRRFKFSNWLGRRVV